ncbi:protein prenylyltransferase [Wilcoxina mikolae CBS 423.85]|nr:protein prenylyltransferase [Wilcoxina mikolae CBS 423.85]
MSHGISRTEYAQSRNAEVKEREHKKLQQYLALVADTQQKRSEDDFTPTALELTSKVLKMNPEFYTMWNYRRQILLRTRFVTFDPPAPPEPGADDSTPPEDQQDPVLVTESLRAAHESRLALLLKEELELLVPLLTAYPKCYWIWNHRLWTLQQTSSLLSPPKAAAFWTKELALVGMMLTRDTRNFNGWMYRRIVVARIENTVQGGHKSMVKDEFEYTMRMIMEVGGMKNYSAWHQRSVLIPRLLEEQGRSEQEKMDFFEDELELLERAITTDPEDQSLWFYHRWLVLAKGETAIAPKMPRLLRIKMLRQQINMLKELLKGHPECKYILNALVLYVQSLQGLRREPPDENDGEDDEDDDEDEDDEGDDDDDDDDDVDESTENRAIIEWLGTLERIDPMRKGRYADLGKALRCAS